MDWVAFSLLTALTFSAYSILQKHTLARYVRSVYALGFLGGTLHLAPSVLILALRPPGDWASWPVVLMLLAGAVNTAIILATYRVMQREPDISRVMPVLDAYPVFVVVMAVLFLGETLTAEKWLALGLVIGGAMLASMHQSLPGARVRLNGSFFFLIAAAFGIALYSVFSKYAVASLGPWQLYALSSVASFPGYLLAAHVGKAWPEVRRVAADRRAMGFTAVTHLALFFGFVTTFLAFSTGPASLASAVMAARPVIVLVWVMLAGIRLTHAWRAGESWTGLWTKGTAALLVTMGVGAMALP